jgi:hypothetical protein
MSFTMLSASLPSVEAYDAFNLSPITIVARMLARALSRRFGLVVPLAVR